MRTDELGRRLPRRLNLRAQQRPELKEQRGASRERLGDSERPTALVADDESAMRDLLQLTLEAAGFKVTAVSSAEALHRFVRLNASHAREPWTPDLIVTDHRMNGATGLEFIAAFRAMDWATPVILISAFADRVLIDDAEALGAQVLAKPFELTQLRECALRCVSGTDA